jgi:site-specific recombinase XerD
VQRQFVFPRKTDEVIAQLLDDRIYVRVEDMRITIHKFFDCFRENNNLNAVPHHQHDPLPVVSAVELFPKELQQKLEDELQARKYSQKTVKMYVFYNRELCKTLQKTPPDITAPDITQYLVYLNKKNLSASSMNLAISAIRFLYDEVLKRGIVQEHHRPHHDKKLPVILSGSEILDILKCMTNSKHRLLLMITYSSGLRVSEVVSLKLTDLDCERQTVLIRSAKGRKDRYIMLSENVISLLREYCGTFHITDWLFPGQPAENHLSIRSAQRIFDQALAKAGIRKEVSIHSLRHSFATHLMENGIEIRYIQELLGHSSVRTTERYTHVAQRSVLKILSPLDSLGKTT